jgi:hypothetical protein
MMITARPSLVRLIGPLIFIQFLDLFSVAYDPYNISPLESGGGVRV